jgi:CRISPR system Cascade subunit CasC
MKVELHLIQNFAPSCLNRDDTNTPKDCEFGGHRRARISSQCIKRAIRWDGTFREQLGDYLSSRSLRFPDQVKQFLTEMGVGEKSANIIGKNLQDIAKSEKRAGEKQTEEKKEDTYELDIFKTPQIVFYTAEEVKACAEAIKALLDQGMKPAEVVKEVKSKKSRDDIFPRPRSADIALLGRMVTSDKFIDVDAACQVAHAISTNKVLMDMDFYTAIDDLQPEEEAGAGMMGITSFNSSCFYRYSLVAMEQLKENLLGKPAQDATPQELKEAEKLALKTLEAFLRASVTAIPTGKQTSFAAQNPPDAIFAVVRDKGAPVSLANAFAEPVRPTNEKSLMQASVEAMDSYWGKLTKVYGEKGIKARPICLVGEAELTSLKDQQVPSFEELLKRVTESVSFEGVK